MPPAPTEDASGSVAVLLYPGCTIAEVIDLSTQLRNAGRTVVHVASTGEQITDQSGLVMVPTGTVATIDAETVDLLAIPGGDPGSIIDDERIADWIRAVADNGMVAGICAGVLVMAASGLLAGRRATHNYRAPWAPREVEDFVSSYWSDVDVEPDPTIGVVTDGSLVTALPGAAIEFAMTVASMVGAIDEARASLVARERRGEHVPELWPRAGEIDG